jgi:anaerobic magnesium-protoporphyrin IX monomethyl ester cyclase
MTRKNQIDLLVINPGNRSQIYQSLGNTLAAIEPPIWAGLITTFIRNHGFSVHILDANAENLTPEQTARKIEEYSPVLTAVVAYGHNPSASTMVMPAASKICKLAKEFDPESKLLLVGGHVAALPERTLQEEQVDFVCGGEGPYTVLELLLTLKSDRPNDFSKVRDLWYFENGQIQITSPAPLLQNLNQHIRSMPWDLLPMEKYRAHNWHCFEHLHHRQPYASIYTTLGCPFHCSYCCIQAPFKRGEQALGYKANRNSYRLWSPEAVIEQIDTLVQNYGVKNIKFADELFVMNRKHVEGICDLIIERGYDVNIWAYARVDTLHEKLLAKMKRAGFNWFCFGFESGSKRVRNDVRKGFAQEKIYNAMKMVEAAGIYVIGNYLFGLPEDDLESMQETLDLAVDLNCEFANFYCAMAYPGSDLYNTAVTEGWPLPKSWSGYSQHSSDSLPLPTKYLAGEEVLRFRDQAFQLYFSNDDYLNMITQKFGPMVNEHIKEMSSHKLERKYI